MRKVSIHIVSFLIISLASAQAQSQSILDSLLGVVEKKIPSHEKITNYVRIATIYESYDSLSCNEYLRLATELAQNNGDEQAELEIEIQKWTIRDLYFNESKKALPILIEKLDFAIEKEYSSAQVDVLNTLSRILHRREHDQAKLYNESALSISNKINYSAGLARALRIQCKWFMANETNEDWKNSIKWQSISRALTLSKQTQLTEEIARTYSDMAGYLNKFQEPDLAKEYHLIALSQFKKVGNFRSIGQVYGDLGLLYFKTGSFIEALNHLYGAIEYLEKVDDKWGIAYAYNRIGQIYLKQKNHKKAIENAKLAINTHLQIGNLGGVYWGNILLSDIYKSMNEPVIALEYAQLALEFAQKEQDDFALSNILMKVGDIYRDQKEFEKSKSFYNESIQIRKPGLPYHSSLVGLSAIYCEEEKFDQALPLLNEVRNSGIIKNNNELLEETYQWLAIAEEGMGNHKRAYEAHVRYKAISDSTLNSDIANRLGFMQAEYEFGQERDSIQNANEKERFQLNEKMRIQRNRQYYAFAGGLILIIFLLILYRYYRAKQKANAKLQLTLQELRQTQNQLVQSEKLASLGQLAAGVAHEINNPINFIKSSSISLNQDLQDVIRLKNKYKEKLQENDIKDNDIEAFEKEIDIQFLEKEIPIQLKDIEEGSDRTSEIVKGLNIFSREENDEMVDVNIEEGINFTLKLVNARINDQIKIQTSFDPNAKIIAGHPNQLNQVFLNIISNALDAIGEEGEIEITTSKSDKDIVIAFADNGSGIPQDIQSKIFDPFFTTKDVGDGTGLGLSISYGIIKNHGGKIEVESKEGEGSTFRITLPTN